MKYLKEQPTNTNKQILKLCKRIDEYAQAMVSLYNMLENSENEKAQKVAEILLDNGLCPIASAVDCATSILDE
jgi:hypothetical protein